MEPLTWPWYGELRPCCPTSQVHPAGTAGGGGALQGPRCVPALPPLALGVQKGGPSRKQSKPTGPYLSGEFSLGCFCPFSSRSLLAVSAPAASSGLGVWLGFGARLELGASDVGQETFPAGSWSILAIAAPGVSTG